MNEQSSDGANPLFLSGEAKASNSARGCLIKTIVCCGIAILSVALLLPAVRRARTSPFRVQCRSNMRQIGSALMNYHNHYGAFPPAFIVDAEGRRLHSWRTLLLPYLDEKKRWDSIDLTKPWDDPANRLARDGMPFVYRCHAAELSDGLTTYMAVIAPDGVFSGSESHKLSEVTDDAGGTLLIIEATLDRAAHWMSPIDVDEAWLTQVGPKTKVSHPGILPAIFANYGSDPLPLDLSAAKKRAFISIAGGD